MAIFVIIAGGLLFIGGTVSLIFGFDIVMTERGSAMTLGGVIAMSGGVITVGIGLCLLRLTQLLGVMEIKRSRHPTLHDRPVVPIVTSSDTRHEEEAVSRLSPQNMALGAGLAAATGLAGGIAVSGPRADMDSAQPHAAPDPTLEPKPIPDPGNNAFTPIAEATLPSPDPASLPDLEAELSRALQESDSPAGIPALPSASSLTGGAAAVEETPSFSHSLNDLLDTTPSRKRRMTVHNPSGLRDPDAALTELLKHDDVSEVASDPGWAMDLPVEGVAVDDDAGGNAQAAQPDETADADELYPTDETLVEHHADSGQQDAVHTSKATAPETDGSEPVEVIVPNAADAPADGKRSGIVGSYKVGGRSYTMFADGSVEAMTESGVQRFESMDQLRRHLADTRA